MIFLQFDNVWQIKTCLHVNQPILSKTQFRRCQGGREIKQRCYLVKHLCAYFMCITSKQVKHQSNQNTCRKRSSWTVREVSPLIRELELGAAKKERKRIQLQSNIMNTGCLKNQCNIAILLFAKLCHSIFQSLMFGLLVQRR